MPSPLHTVFSKIKHIHAWLLRHIRSSPIEGSRSTSSYVGEIVLGCIFLFLLLAWYIATPAFTDLQYTLSGSEERHEQKDGMFFSFESTDPLMTVTFRLHQGKWLQPSRFVLRADDCLSELVINTIAVPEEVFGPCVIDTPKEIHLGTFLHAGINEITAIVPDTGGRQGFDMHPSSQDALLLSLRIAVFVVFLLLSLFLIWRRCSVRETKYVALLFLLGILLRLIYFDATPFTVRSNDADGHMDYIHSVSEHWKLPLISEGWEFYQPPLYYFASAPLYRIAKAAFLSYASIARLIQFSALLLSLVVLGLCVRISSLLFERHQRSERYLWLGFFSVFSGMVFLSPSLNNDALASVLIFAAVFLCLTFWHSGHARSWYALMLLISMGILTKMNMVLLLPVALLTLLLHPIVTRRSKAIFLVTGLLIVLSLTEWIFVFRMVQDANVGIIGNFGNLNSDLSISNHLVDYLTFNPFGILHHPYANPWQDSDRRMYFLEFLFRSAFFGEFDFGGSLRVFSQLLLALGSLVIALSVLGGTLAMRSHWRRALPLWILFAVLLLGHAYFRYIYPYSSSEHFRYSLALLLPLWYFALLTVSRFGSGARTILLSLLWLFIISNTAFVITVSILRPL